MLLLQLTTHMSVMGPANLLVEVHERIGPGTDTTDTTNDLSFGINRDGKNVETS